MPFVNFPVICEVCGYQLVMEPIIRGCDLVYRHDYGKGEITSLGWDNYEKCPNWGKRYCIVESPVRVKEI